LSRVRLSATLLLEIRSNQTIKCTQHQSKVKKKTTQKQKTPK